MDVVEEASSALSAEAVSVLFSVLYHWNLAQHSPPCSGTRGQGLSAGHQSQPWETVAQSGCG